MFKKTLLLFSMLLVVGCVQPQYPSTLSGGGVVLGSPVKKVGYLVNVEAYPTHTHIGTTSLTNFTKSYPFKWDIPHYVERQLATELTQIAGVTPVNLRALGIMPHEVNGLIKYHNGVYMVASGKAEVYQRLAQQLGLSAVVIVNQSEKQAFKDCGLLGCNEVKVKGYGLLSQSFINSNKFYSATPFYAHLYRLKPLEDLDRYLVKINQDPDMTLVATSVGEKVKPNKIGFVYPKRFNDWTESEFKPFLAPLQRYIQKMSELIATVVRDKV